MALVAGVSVYLDRDEHGWRLFISEFGPTGEEVGSQEHFALDRCDRISDAHDAASEALGAVLSHL